MKLQCSLEFNVFFLRKLWVCVCLPCLIFAPTPAFSDSKIFYIHSDHLNTPQALTDSSQQVVWRVEEQTPFGEVQVNQDADGDGEDVVFNLRFPGQYFDMETGTNYNYYRTYDPSLGRYIQSDPIGLRGGLNTYTYVGGNPVGLIDYYGLRPVPGSAGPHPGGWGLVEHDMGIG